MGSDGRILAQMSGSAEALHTPSILQVQDQAACGGAPAVLLGGRRERARGGGRPAGWRPAARPVAPARACGSRRAGTGGGPVAAPRSLVAVTNVDAVQSCSATSCGHNVLGWRWQYDHMQRSL
jgi:hypothetical protein